MSVQRYKLIFILIFFIHHTSIAAATAGAGGDPHAFHHHSAQGRPGGRAVGTGGPPANLVPDGRPLFSPRLEYNEWHPVGRGDPLKNDPTYDYSPPVLERVRYWSDNMANKDKEKDILLLGVPSKKTSSKVEHQWVNNNNNNNNGPVRRNYYPQQAMSINELPTVLMPPPMSNQLQPDERFLWTQATTHQAQRYEPQAEGFRYRPGPPAHPSQSFTNQQYSGQKYTEPSKHHAPSYQQQQQQPQQQQLPHPNQHYATTIRLPHEYSSKKPILHSILQNEKAYPFTKAATTTTLTEYTSHFYSPQNINAMATTIIHPPQTTEYLNTEPSSSLPPVSTDIRAPHVTPAAFVSPMMTPITTTVAMPTPTTTTTTTTTTPVPPRSVTEEDPFLAHLKLANPPKRPQYLIIEGHSKVKTYGLNNNDTLMQLPKMVPVVGSEDPVIRHVVNRDEAGGAVEVPHMRPTMGPTPSSSAEEEETSEEKTAVNSLLSLLGSSFGDYFSADGVSNGNSIDSAERSDKDSKARRNARSVPDRLHLYVEGSFQIGEQQDEDQSGSLNDDYRRGIVLDESEDGFTY